jgi:hypothetical protein
MDMYRSTVATGYLMAVRQETQDSTHTGIIPQTFRLATISPKNLKNAIHIDLSIFSSFGTFGSLDLDGSLVLHIHGGNGIAKASRISLPNTMDATIYPDFRSVHAPT